MAVLVNHYSASASEIVSACLQDHKRAVVIGERTWGKGSVQNVIELEEGKSALKLTTASYHRPSGKNIHRFPEAKESDEWGVMPDDGYEVKMNGAETARLIEYRRRRDILIGKHEKALATSETPAADKPAEQPTPDEAKPSSRRPTKPNPTKPNPTRQSRTSKPDETARRSPPTEDKPDERKPDEKPAEQAGGATSRPTDMPADGEPFVDRQLQKAVDYLSWRAGQGSGQRELPRRPIWLQTAGTPPPNARSPVSQDREIVAR